ncbi:MAG: 4Fe-4S dicluster domain-containing protein [Candidatus Omnitrophota bacterium]
MPSIYFTESSQLENFFNQLKKEFRVFAPVVKDPQAKVVDYYCQQALPETPLIYNAYRVVEPLKSFFTFPFEKAGDYFSVDKDISEIAEKTVLFGVKSCDIAGHKIQDFVFLEGVEVDNLYKLRRENSIFISSDCTDFKEVCHCLAWEILPHPTVGFDLNLSPLNHGYLVEAGSIKGEELIHKHKANFIPAKETQISARKVKRDNFIDRLRRHLLPQNLVPRDRVQKVMKEAYNADTWKEFMLTCVECGGCNFICDTCHCFLLGDQKKGALNSKVRVWDSCLYAGYARVAGGANPINTRAKRLRNRFMKKFDFFIDNLGLPACCGCGRCIEVCPAKIDIREVLKDADKKANLVIGNQ